MLRRKYMAQIPVFVYTCIIILSILLVTYGEPIPCETDADCPWKIYPLIMKCIEKNCQYTIASY
uniref:Nodule-specific cysteine-rich peptide L51 n=1 Tax=Lens culinaris TaxID=3864 RepID=A0A7T8DVD4_LENCU|nr:nodule-specific cysteine-rich peptide L51 [Lens culinaris]